MKGLYEQEHFTRNQVPIRIFRHHYVNDRMFTVNHWHRSVEINLILSGEVYQTVGEETFLTGPGDLFLVNSGVIHANRCESDQAEIKAITLQISAGFLNQWMGEKLWYRLPETIEGQQEIRSVLNLLAANEIPEEVRPLRQMEYIFRLMAVLRPWCEHYNDSLQKEGILHFAQVLDYIETHYQEELSLNTLADRFGYSPAYLSRAFKRYIGDNYHRHIQVVRLNQTINDLRNHPERSILACAEENGFSNIKSFIGIFKEEYGCTPSQWRQKEDRTQSGVSVITIE